MSFLDERVWGVETGLTVYKFRACSQVSPICLPKTLTLTLEPQLRAAAGEQTMDSNAFREAAKAAIDDCASPKRLLPVVN